MRDKAAICFALGLLVAGCASGAAPSARSAAMSTTIDVRTLPPWPSPTMAHPHPTYPPCVYPTSSTGLANVAAESDLVVEATIEPRLVLVDNGSVSVWRQPLDDVTVVRIRAGASAHVDGLVEIQQEGETHPGFWPPGRQLLFLLPVNNGMSSPADGMFGMFAIENGNAVRYCPSADDPEHPFVAPGPAPTLASVIALIPDPLPARP
jgi:hypothetical protein